MTISRSFPGAAWLGALYAAGARARRARFARSPELVHHLAHPVISIGNLRVGGSGKTPLVALLAEWLRDAGERPAILSRGYGRRQAAGVVVVSDGAALLADVARAGDEPFMLARRLPGVAVVVASDRHLAGRVAEDRCGATVHLLDDGFQHFRLARDLDLVLVTRDDVRRDAVLPAGRLREPVAALRHAGAVVVMDASLGDARAAVAHVVRPDVLVVAGRRRLGAPVEIESDRHRPESPSPFPAGSRSCLALSGIARPERFAADLTAAGWDVRATMVFADHHDYSARDMGRIRAEAVRRGAALVVTTEKDAVRLLKWRPLPFDVAWVPMRVEIDPEGDLRELLRATLVTARASRARHASEAHA